MSGSSSVASGTDTCCRNASTIGATYVVPSATVVIATRIHAARLRRAAVNRTGYPDRVSVAAYAEMAPLLPAARPHAPLPEVTQSD